MIIQVRGTNGSGKTTVVRRVMQSVGDWDAVKVANRRQPLYYKSIDCPKQVVALGHYETATGGCDTIPKAKDVYDLAASFDEPTVVLMEGIFLSEDTKWTKLLAEKHTVHALFLTTPLDQCVRQVLSRRAEGGNDKELDPTRMTRRFHDIERCRRKMVELGLNARRVSSDQAVRVTLNLLES